ncbi:MAG: FAD-dependent oxidoreductase [Sphingomonadales bacterium]|jgi:pyruvate/2-oxoglutarate dehydrogenase complex dihydrolipoamide dehydrogenase (E3) component
MAKLRKTHLCVIGAGAGGLSVAAGAAQLGVKTMLIERGQMGGDCLNTGCVPSKSLLAAAAQNMSWNEAQVHLRKVIADIEPHDSQERFEGLGVEVLRDSAHFIDPKTIEVGGERIRAKRFVIATGGRPFIPDIPGLESVDYVTNETLFNLKHCPKHLLIIGGGPVAMEMAQAHKRLGAKVTVVEKLDLLGKDDPEARKVVVGALQNEGVMLYDYADVTLVEKEGDEIALHFTKDGHNHIVTGSHLLIAAGRVPNIEDLNLSVANVETTPQGIEVDSRLRTTNKRIYAIGDVTGGYLFTHIAGYDAGIVIRNALFKLPAKASYSAAPWVTYTDPELAHVGLREDEARSRHGEIRVLKSEFAENDRARCEGRTTGFAKVLVHQSGRVLGATIVGPHAGELIQIWILALNKGLKIRDLTGYIAPYPTYGEITKRIAGDYYKDSLFSPRTRMLIKVLSYFG